MTKKERYTGVLNWFNDNVPVAETELDYDTPFHLLVAVILSAQCTDKRVNMVTPALFEAYPTPEVMAVSSAEVIFEYIKSISYPNSKAKNLLGMAQKIMADYNGEVPQDRDSLESLPGVGRKTANVMLIVAFNKPAMPVDTHVFRVSNRIGLTTNSKNPLQTEKELLKYIPQELLGKAHHWLILHGRYTCLARKPKCLECKISEYCRYFAKSSKKEAKIEE
ncbi:endonuclease III [Dysgonomonas massiliensis]|uniref:endonuclease III n=1 Tax=Dysgonomonas massiliensis TaxID=2040292 RepID=UPI000C77CC68|nr:endonuclease III [Dysgonomonas massiliensis]